MKRKKISDFFAIFLALVGTCIIVYVLFPIVKSYSDARQYYPDLVSPISGKDLYFEGVDYTDANNWFPKETIQFTDSEIKYYTISIPKLRIKDATVSIGGEDLSEFLIQYPGTALPGKIGNSVIFGHSILPQYYDPEDYLAIFSLLPTLKDGDEISVRYDGINYLYRVVDKFEVYPTNIEVLDQGDNTILSLITCTPPGHPLKPKRLVVRAELVPFGKIDI